MILFSAFRAADRINFKRNVFYPYIFKYLPRKGNYLSISRRVSRSHTLNTELVEFAKSSCLWLFIAIATAYIANLCGQRPVYYSVFYSASDNSGSKLGTKRYRAAAFIIKGVHFLLYNIGRVSNTALKHLCMLKNRNTDFLKPEKLSGFKHFSFYKLPASALLR